MFTLGVHLLMCTCTNSSWKLCTSVICKACDLQTREWTVASVTNSEAEGKMMRVLNWTDGFIYGKYQTFIQNSHHYLNYDTTLHQCTDRVGHVELFRLKYWNIYLIKNLQWIILQHILFFFWLVFFLQSSCFQAVSPFFMKTCWFSVYEVFVCALQTMLIRIQNKQFTVRYHSSSFCADSFCTADLCRCG